MHGEAYIMAGRPNGTLYVGVTWERACDDMDGAGNPGWRDLSGEICAWQTVDSIPAFCGNDDVDAE